MASLVSPHGAKSLKPLMLEGAALAAEKARAAGLPKLKVSSREKGDLIMLGIGGFTPLEGFMGKADWQGVCDRYQMANGLFWPIPITLSASKAEADAIPANGEVALVDPDDGSILATMKVAEKYSIDKSHECQSVFRTTDAKHPGVAMVMAQAEVNLAGPVKVLSDGGFKAKYGALYMTPAETRALFEKLGWSKVAAFQTRNPMHRSHLIVGRDHAGVVSYYGPFDAHKIFDEIPEGSLETQALKMDVTFWCYKCGGMASSRTCAHTDADRLQVSGTQLRKWLGEGAPVPPEFSRAEVLQVLKEYYATQDAK